MSPRRREANQEIREKRRAQILDAALTIYIERGYSGADMDDVAAGAGLAKGLVYYYFGGKQNLFRAAFEWAFERYASASREILDRLSSQAPLDRLVRYLQGIHDLARDDPRAIRFAMRLPFDAHAVYGRKESPSAMARAGLHQRALAALVTELVAAGEAPPVDADQAASSFWAVFVAGTFSLVSMSGGAAVRAGGSPGDHQMDQLRGVITFCLQGLGVPRRRIDQCIGRMEETR